MKRNKFMKCVVAAWTYDRKRYNFLFFLNFLFAWANISFYNQSAFQILPSITVETVETSEEGKQKIIIWG